MGYTEEQEEIWRPVVGYEGYYEVSNLGRVRSLDREVYAGHGATMIKKGRVLAQTNNHKYKNVHLSIDGHARKPTVHRLVAEAFLENPDNLPMVNHKDENPHNNNVNNLEWCTCKYNNNYGTKNERISKAMTNGKNSKGVLQYDLEGNLVGAFPSMKQATRELGYDNSAISACCIGKAKTSYGYVWRYNESGVLPCFLNNY